MKTLLITLLAIFSLNLWADENTIEESSYNFIKINIGQGKPYFLELGSDKCHGCKDMGIELYKVTKEHPNYNISYVNISKDRRVAQILEIQIIPTQIIYDKDGAEVYRHVGKLSFKELEDTFKKYNF